MNSEGYIKIDRKMVKWEHYKDGNVLRVFLDLMFAARTIETKKNGKTVAAGTVLTTINEIKERTGIKSSHTIIDALATLEKSGEITRERSGNETIVTINQFLTYQGSAKNAHPKEEGSAKNAQPQCKKCTTSSAKNAQPHLLYEDNKLSSIERTIKEQLKNTDQGAREEKIEPQKPQKIGFEKYGPDGLVELRPAEYRTLAEQYGEDQLKDAIKGLNDNIADGSTESTSHYHTLRKWLDYRKKNDKPQKTWKVDLNAFKI